MSGACVNLGGVIVCYETCWACRFDEHHEPPAWHTWADTDDIEWAERTGQPDPREQRCGCDCANAPHANGDPT